MNKHRCFPVNIMICSRISLSHILNIAICSRTSLSQILNIAICSRTSLSQILNKLQPFKSSFHIELTIFCFCIFILHTIKICETKYLNFIKWYMFFHVCSLPFIVQTHCSLFPKRLLLFSQNSAKYCAVCQLQENNPEILECFEFATSSDKLLIQQKKLWRSWRFQNNVSTPNL